MKVTRVNGSGWNATKGIWAINLISLEAAKGQKLNTKKWNNTKLFEQFCSWKVRFKWNNFGLSVTS